LAGVAGGLADYTGVDAVVFRVLFAVLTLFGGAGLLLYLIGWLLLPDEGQESAPVESLLGRGRSSSAIEAATAGRRHRCARARAHPARRRRRRAARGRRGGHRP